MLSETFDEILLFLYLIPENNCLQMYIHPENNDPFFPHIFMTNEDNSLISRLYKRLLTYLVGKQDAIKKEKVR